MGLQRRCERSPKPIIKFGTPWYTSYVGLLGIAISLYRVRKEGRKKDGERERELSIDTSALPSPLVYAVLFIELFICCRLHRHCEHNTNMLRKGIRSSRPHFGHPRASLWYRFMQSENKAKKQNWLNHMIEVYIVKVSLSGVHYIALQVLGWLQWNSFSQKYLRTNPLGRCSCLFC